MRAGVCVCVCVCVRVCVCVSCLTNVVRAVPQLLQPRGQIAIVDLERFELLVTAAAAIVRADEVCEVGVVLELAAQQAHTGRAADRRVHLQSKSPGQCRGLNTCKTYTYAH